MNLLVPLAAAGLVLCGIAARPHLEDRAAPSPRIELAEQSATPPDAMGPPPRRMICVIDTPFPDHQEHCATHAGYPGSPCRCEGALFDGVRDFVE